MRCKCSLILILALPFLSGCLRAPQTVIHLSTPSGFNTEGWLYKAQGKTKPVAIVFLHGKRGNPGVPHSQKFISALNQAGYTVLAPLMPWSKKRHYEGTRSQGMEVIDAAIAVFGQRHVVVIGHSMGATAVLQYGAGHPDDRVLGLVAVTPGHDPNIATALRRFTAHDAASACRMTRHGKAKQRRDFAEMRRGEPSTINTTAEYYCSYYSVKEYPDTRVIVTSIRLPLLWIAGSEDSRTRAYDMAGLFARVPDNKHSVYELLRGTHKSVLFNHVAAMTQWIGGL